MTKQAQFIDKVYKLTREAAPLSFMLPTRNSKRFPLLWFDEKTGINRPLRYAKNQRTPFEDEQDGNAILDPVIFEDGFLRVQRTNQVLQEFLYYHPLNGIKFTEMDEEKDAQAVVDKMNLEADALIEARQLSLEQVESIGRVLLNRDISKISGAEIKREILVFARKEPETFLNMLKDPMLKLQSKVQLLFDEKLLSFRNKNREVWINTAAKKNKMINVPFNANGKEAVVDYFLTEDGVEVLMFLENILES